MRLTRLVVSLVLLVVAVVHGQWLETPPAASSQPRFNPKDVVRRVRSRGIEGTAPDRFQPSAGSREPFALNGEFLIDTNITPVLSPDAEVEPATAFDGTNFLVVWEEGGYSIHGARVTPAGAVLDPAGIAISTGAIDQLAPAVAFDGANFLVVWQDYRGGRYCIYGARVTAGGIVLDPSGIAISDAAIGQMRPAVAFDRTNSLVVWQDYRSGSCTDIYGARVTTDGMVLDSSGIAISTSADFQASPCVAFDGTNLLVVWHDLRSGSSYDIYGARVTPAGRVLDTSGIAISTSADFQSSPAIAFDGPNSLVVWHDLRSGSDYDIYGSRVTPQGTVLDPHGIAICTAALSQVVPAVSFDGTNSLVVWQNCGSDSSHDIYGARVTPAGVVLDPAGIAISSAEDDQDGPALAFDGTEFLVVWYDYRNDFLYDTGIYGARVTPGGVVLDPSGILISTDPGWQGDPALAFDGANFLAVWYDHRSPSHDYEIYGARVNQAGVVFDEGPVVRQEGAQGYPALASGSGGQMLLAYEGWAGTTGGKTYNTYRIWGKVNPSPAIAEMTKPEVPMTNGGATFVRGVLLLAEVSSRKPQAAGLLDISGRKVLDLKPGANDVRALAPGVYFVVEPGTGNQELRTTTKVIVTR